MEILPLGTIKNKSPIETNLMIRIPGWSKNASVPSDLYTFQKKSNKLTTIKVNGKTIPLVLKNGYAVIEPTSISPVHRLQGGIGPSIIFHGTADKTVPFRTAEIFHKMTTAKGNNCTLVAYKGEGHVFFNYTRNDNGPFIDTMSKLDYFLIENGYLPEGPRSKVY